jgi:hypothetical protein
MPKYDLLIKGGRMADFLTGKDGMYDVAVRGGTIELVAEDIPINDAANVVKASGLVVLPGITDLHTHIASEKYEGNAFKMLARAGVTTALDCGGPIEALLEGARSSPAGINVACIQRIKPGDTVSSTSPPAAEFQSVLDRWLDAGALGLKLLGGHFPLTPEATARAIDVCNQNKAYVCFHVGTLATGAGTLRSFREAVELAGPNHLHLAHVNSYCRGQVLGDPVAETLEALETLDANRNLVSEAYLAVFSGSPGKCVDGMLESLGPRNSLSMAGYGGSESEMARALLDGFAGVVAAAGDDNIVLHGKEAYECWRSHGTDVTCTFPVTPASTRFLLATGKKGGRFVVDAISTDGGGIPRNFILSKGLALVHLDFMSLVEFAGKASYFPSQVLGLKAKGSLSPGFDADITIVDLESRRPVMSFVRGEPLMVDGVIVKREPTIITTAHGEEELLGDGFRTLSVSVEDSWFYTGRPV